MESFWKSTANQESGLGTRLGEGQGPGCADGAGHAEGAAVTATSCSFKLRERTRPEEGNNLLSLVFAQSLKHVSIRVISQEIRGGRAGSLPPHRLGSGALVRSSRSHTQSEGQELPSSSPPRVPVCPSTEPRPHGGLTAVTREGHSSPPGLAG